MVVFFLHKCLYRLMHAGENCVPVHLFSEIYTLTGLAVEFLITLKGRSQSLGSSLSVEQVANTAKVQLPQGASTQIFEKYPEGRKKQH